MIDAVRNIGGFQGSEHTGVEVRFYPQGGDPVVLDQESFGPTGRLRYDPNPSIIAASTNEQLGAASGTWSVTLKEGKRHQIRALFDALVDDDWADISFFRYGKRWHVMRGLVEDIRRSRQAALDRGTTIVWTISGRSFGAIWEKTPIWFNVYSDENVSGSVSQRVFQSGENILGNPAVAVDGYLFGFLRELGGVGRATWAMPKGMPGVGARFVDSFEHNFLGYPDDPQLFGVNNNWLCPTGNLWALAKEWSDPMFNELIPGIYRRSDSRPDFDLQPGKELTPDDSKMFVIFRERPFPTISKRNFSPWFKLPMWVVPKQMIVSDNVGRSGMERYNAFFVAPQLVQEVLPEAGVDIAQPLWDEDDILRHGLRRLDIVSKYTSLNADLAGLSTQQRIKVRDWYCLNPYLLNGSIELGIGLPDIRTGVRFRVLDPRDVKKDTTYYVESVGQNWTFGPGLKTTLGVTRGWVGSDDTLLQALENVTNRYTTASRAKPDEFAPDPGLGVE